MTFVQDSLDGLQLWKHLCHQNFFRHHTVWSCPFVHFTPKSRSDLQPSPCLWVDASTLRGSEDFVSSIVFGSATWNVVGKRGRIGDEFAEDSECLLRKQDQTLRQVTVITGLEISVGLCQIRKMLITQLDQIRRVDGSHFELVHCVNSSFTRYVCR